MLITLTFLLSSCGDREEKRELQLYITQLKNAASKNEKNPLPIQFQLPNPVLYISSLTPSGPNSANSGVVSKPLQSYPLKDLQFVGTIAQDNETWAYILTPDNMIYGAKEGDIIGNTYGKIVKIATDHIEVLEKHTVSGKPVDQIVTMQLKE